MRFLTSINYDNWTANSKWLKLTNAPYCFPVLSLKQTTNFYKHHLPAWTQSSEFFWLLTAAFIVVGDWVCPQEPNRGNFSKEKKKNRHMKTTWSKAVWEYWQYLFCFNMMTINMPNEMHEIDSYTALTTQPFSCQVQKLWGKLLSQH